MKTKNQQSLRTIQTLDQTLWKHYARLNKFSAELIRVKDASATRQIQAQSAPVDLLPLIF